MNGRGFFHNLDGKFTAETTNLVVGLKQKSWFSWVENYIFPMAKFRHEEAGSNVDFYDKENICSLMFKEIPDFSESKGSSTHLRRCLGPQSGITVIGMPLKPLSLSFYTGQLWPSLTLFALYTHWR